MEIKITSLIVALSLILSLFTVYSFAAGAASGAEATYTTTKVYYKNTFGDAEDDIGGDKTLSNASNSTFEKKKDANGNNYGYYNFNDSDKNVFMEFVLNDTPNIGPESLGYVIFEMDFNDFGNPLGTSKFFDVNSGKGSFGDGRIAASDILNIANDAGGNYFYPDNDKSQKIYIQSNTWVHIRCEFSVLSTTASKYQLRCYIGDQYFESSYTLGSPAMIYQIRLGSTKTVNQKFGLDNIMLYTTPDNSTPPPTGGILAMKVGAENARLNNTQVELEHAPMLINGQIFCPVDIIEHFTGYECPPEYILILENSEYIHIDNVEKAFGALVKSYDMGLVLIGNHESYLSDSSTYGDIADLMKTFVFNLPTEEELISDVQTYTNGFDHPYLLVNGDRFAELRSVYSRGNSGKITDSEEAALYEYIKRYIESAKSTYKNYCSTDITAKYNGITKIPVNNNYNKYQNNGYDNGGRLSVDTTPLLYFAFAYQITGNMNYARAAYDYMIHLGNWNHWGPDHFLNCADTAAPFAIAYDWLYDAFVELNRDGEISKADSEVYDKSKLATILFTHVIIPGYVQSNNLTCPWPGSAGSRYATKTSNWNAVCVSGVVMSALMLLEENVSTAGMTFQTQVKKSSTSFTQTTTKIEEIGKASIHTGLSTYSDYAAKLTAMNLGTLAEYGLEQYYPDGSYIESPSYWSYGTNSFFRLIASLLSSTGDDYGFMDAWGIDTTCYFAIHSESSDYNTWNFNDGSVGKQDSSFFFFVGGFYGDDNLIRVRKKHLNNGKGYSIYDILFYDIEVVGEPELSTEYAMVGIDAFSVRSSWDKGAIYAGIIGGPNTVSHGQLDAGSFIYHNNGKIWFTDLGADNYNMSGGYFSNFNLYRVGGEGHNMMLITSEQDTLPYGQSKTANPHISKSYSGTNGGYAVLDMSDSYGTHVKSGQRGLLFTNSRSTVVIQDEYVFDGAKTAYWFGHYQVANGYVDEVVISADGRTAFMISGDDIIRVSIVSDNQDLKFEIMDAYTYVLNTTKRTDKSTMGGATTESSRDNFKKLAIKCENVTELNLAVVIEEVNGYELGTSYEYITIDEWELNSANNSIIDEKYKADFDKSSISTGSYQLNSQPGNYTLGYYNAENLSHLQILSNAAINQSDGSFNLYFKNNSALKLSEYSYVAFDTDIFTDSSFIDNSTIGINVKSKSGSVEFIPLITLSDNKLIANGSTVTLRESFVHLTLILDTELGCVYLYADDIFVTKITGVIYSESDAITSVEINLRAGDELSAIFLDNISVRGIGLEYDDTILSSLLDTSSSLLFWNDRLTYQSVSVPLAQTDDRVLYTTSQIENAISNGNNVTLLRSTTGLVNVSSAVRVNTNGYRFNFVSDKYVCRQVGNHLLFESGTVTVTWHIGNETLKETYTSSNVATFKGSSTAIGKITYNKIESAGGTIFNFFSTAWSDEHGGDALSSSEMIVSSENCEFWLVNNLPANSMFAKIDSNGNVTLYNTESQLRNFLNTNNGTYDLVLCRDLEMTHTSAISIASSGKTLYLNGHTLSYNQYDVHMFSYNGAATGNFNIIGPGTLEVDGARAIFTSTSSTTDKTSNYGIVAENVSFKFNTQFADLRVGQHKFVNCDIQQTSTSKALLALWNKNGSLTSGGAPQNLLSVTFDKSSIKTSAGFVSYSAGSYSEVYLLDSALSAATYLFESTNEKLKFHVSGNSSLSAAKLVADTTKTYSDVVFNNGVITNLEIPNKYLISGAALTKSYDSTLIYRVSDAYATVIWKDHNGSVIATELVGVGVTPKITNAAVVNYLKTSGKGYTYHLTAISNTSEVVLTPVQEASSLLISMTVDVDLTMYLYISKEDMDANVQLVKVDGIRLMKNAYELVSIDGVDYYRYSILNFAPANASEAIEIVIEYADGTVQQFTTSAVEYLEELLILSDSDTEKTLVVKLLRYIHRAQVYFGTTSMFEQNKILGIIEQYKQYDLIFGNLKEDNITTGLLRHVIDSACFNLSASLKIKFYLNDSYTGVLHATLNGVTTVYQITNGTVKGNNYVEIVIPAHCINDSLTLSDGYTSIEYGLNAYYTAINNTDYELSQLLSCLSEYSSAAKKHISE